MMIKRVKNLFLSALIITLISTVGSKASEECFEGFSRSVFKFNMVLMILSSNRLRKDTINYQSL